MFYRENLERSLEKHRNTELREVCRKIYYVIITVIARKRFLQAKARIVQCQKFVKVCVCVFCVYVFLLCVCVHMCVCVCVRVYTFEWVWVCT